MNRFITALIVCTCLAGTLSAATFTVTTLDDAGPGSFRAAIDHAVSNWTTPNTIVFDSSLSWPATIDVETAFADLDGSMDLTIEGPGSHLLTLYRDPGRPPFRFLQVRQSSSLRLSGMTMEGGLTESTGTLARGGAIAAESSTTLIVDDMVFKDCVCRSTHVATGAGGSARGGAIFALGTFHLSNVDFLNCAAEGGNSLSGSGGHALGGAVYATSVAGLSVTHVTVTGCHAIAGDGTDSTDGFASGGGLCIAGDTLVVSDVVVSNCQAIAGQVDSGTTGGSGEGGGVFCSATSFGSLARVTITDCLAQGGGSSDGGVPGGYAKGGGLLVTGQNGVFSMTDLVIRNCQCIGGTNSVTATEGGDAFGAAFAQDGAGTLIVSRAHVHDCESTSDRTDPIISVINLESTTMLMFHSTVANCEGGAISVIVGSSLSLRQCTISGNTGHLFGGIICSSNSSVSAVNSTIVMNRAAVPGGSTGGIYAVGTMADVSLDHCIVAANSITGTIGGSDVGGTGTYSGGFNIIGAGGGGFTNGVDGNQTGSSAIPLSPDLAALADNGGFAPTHLPHAGSPAIDTGTTTDDVAVPIDQRGAPRFINGIRDIGAIELNPATPTLTISAGVLGLSSSKPAGSYEVTGTDLGGDVRLYAPPGFSISDAATGPFNTLVVLTTTGGALNTTVYVRYVTAESASGQIRHVSPLLPAATKDINGAPAARGNSGGGDDGGCSTGDGRSSWLLLLGLIAVVGMVRRVRRA